MFHDVHHHMVVSPSINPSESSSCNIPKIEYFEIKKYKTIFLYKNKNMIHKPVISIKSTQI